MKTFHLSWTVLVLLICGILFFGSCKKESKPTIETIKITMITDSSASTGGVISNDGKSHIYERGVVWSTSNNPTVEDNDGISSDGDGMGVYGSKLTELSKATNYFVRAYASNSVGTSYGEELEFSTLGTIPSVETIEISQITNSSASSGGIVTENGGLPVLERGVVWSTSTNPTIVDNDGMTLNGEGVGEFSSELTRLSEITRYFVRAYASNSEGTSYGEELEFKTLGLPSLDTVTVLELSLSSVLVNGLIEHDGGTQITSVGILWDYEVNPTIENHLGIIYSDVTSQTITDTISNLTPMTEYYVRVFAENAFGVAYSVSVSFKTDKVMDIEGNTYDVVKIGEQFWMAENLKVTKFNDGTPVDYLFDPTEWATTNSPAYSWYENDPDAYKDVFGALYNFFTVDKSKIGNKNICPKNWRVPTYDDIMLLENYLVYNGYYYGFDYLAIAKSMAASSGWTESQVPGVPGNEMHLNNTSGFSALPAGRRNYNDGTFHRKSDYAYWWSTSDYLDGFEDRVWIMEIRYNNPYLVKYGTFKRGGFSVRCLMD